MSGKLVLAPSLKTIAKTANTILKKDRQERRYSILIVSAAENFNTLSAQCFPKARWTDAFPNAKSRKISSKPIHKQKAVKRPPKGIKI